MKRRTSGLIDPKNHHKIPLSPPLPKGETPVSSLWQREVGRDFRNRFQTAQGIHFLKFLFIGLLVFLVAFSCKEKAEKSSLPKIGTAAIDFSCQDLKGQTWNLEKIKGKVVLLRFWTDWCPHCRYEMPVIENYYRKLNKEGFVVLAVNVKQSSQVAEAFAAQFDVTFPILVDSDGKLAQRYGVHSIPTNFLIDR
ncbi:MAG: TlpA disulfide reductase family protein, partial [Thermodesulfobacteriota bacterium]